MEDVKFIHLRKKNGATGELRAKGGLTIAVAKDPNDPSAAKNWYIYSIAKCSRKDQFNRKIGRNVSAGRIKAYVNGRDSTEHVLFIEAESIDIDKVVDDIRDVYKAKGYV